MRSRGAALGFMWLAWVGTTVSCSADKQPPAAHAKRPQSGVQAARQTPRPVKQLWHEPLDRFVRMRLDLEWQRWSASQVGAGLPAELRKAYDDAHAQMATLRALAAADIAAEQRSRECAQQRRPDPLSKKLEQDQRRTHEAYRRAYERIRKRVGEDRARLEKSVSFSSTPDVKQALALVRLLEQEQEAMRMMHVRVASKNPWHTWFEFAQQSGARDGASSLSVQWLGSAAGTSPSSRDDGLEVRWELARAAWSGWDWATADKALAEVTSVARPVAFAV